LRIRLIASFSLLIALLAALMFWKISSGIQAHREAVFVQTKSFARAMGSHVDSDARVIDLSLLRAAEALGVLGPQPLSDQARTRQVLAVSASVSDASFWIHFVDSRGKGVAASTGFQSPTFPTLTAPISQPIHRAEKPDCMWALRK
jgi:hypothetical protein